MVELWRETKVAQKKADIMRISLLMIINEIQP